MRTFDLTPLLRHSVGFDRLDELFETAFRSQAAQDSSYPPYNIAKLGEATYRITLAVAGFDQSDLEIISEENVLTVRGRTSEREGEVQYLHRGIARRAFEHRFQLADHVRVVSAALDRGLLDIDLMLELPEVKKALKIEIGSGKPGVVGG